MKIKMVRDLFDYEKAVIDAAVMIYTMHMTAAMNADVEGEGVDVESMQVDAVIEAQELVDRALECVRE